VLSPQPTPADRPELFLTAFYGIGGVGKSALGAKAREMAAEHKPVVLVTVDFDTSGWTVDSPFVAVAGELVRAFLEHGIPAPFSTVLVTLHSLNSMPSSEGAGKQAQEMGLELLDKGAELSQGVPGLGLLLKLGKWMYDRAQRKEVEMATRDLGLWPVERGGRIDLIDLEQKIAVALFEDLRTFLSKDNRHVRVLLDGFERLQSHERKGDAQIRLQELLGYCAASPDRLAFDRLRVIVLSREELRWDALYDEPDWRLHWRQHLLNGLAEPDAREYLGRWQHWFLGNKQEAVALALANAEDDILRASDESVSGEHAFSPFYLTLAVELVERSAIGARPADLGKTPAELQDRFLRYLGRAECRALMVLSLAGVFDEALFDWLSEQRVIEFGVHSFHTALRQDHSYFQTAGPTTWRFQRLFEKALRSRWTGDEAVRQECRSIIKRLLDYYAAPLLQTAERDWTDKEVNAWSSGMEIITAQGLEAGLLDYDEWENLTLNNPWSSKSYKCASARLSFLRRVLAVQENLKGPEHSDTLTSVNNLAGLFYAKGDWTNAEPLYRRGLEASERALGPEHPDTLTSVNNLASVLSAKGDSEAAEPLYRRALEACERVLGPEHPATLTSVNNLASVLNAKGDWVAAERLYRRGLEACELVLGPEHPNTLTSLSNLAFLLNTKGDFAGAEPLSRRALEVRERVLGPEHPDTLTSLNNLAGIFYAKRDWTNAEPLLRRALEVRERTLGPEHPDTIKIANNLASLSYAKGDWTRAELLLRRALDACERVLGPEHPDTLTSLNNLASVLKAKGDSAAAEPLLRRALEVRERVLGLEHPDTLTSVNNLASVLNAKGDSAAAERLYRRALEACERVLGPEHPATLTSVINLASVFIANGDSTAAESLLSRALQVRERVLGPEHPDTLTSLINMASFFYTKEDWTSAEPLLRRALEVRERTLVVHFINTLTCFRLY
jgi:tetratricopeptide (TPR) repeat protein